MIRWVIIHVDEIALKQGNRVKFEQRLIQNIYSSLKPYAPIQFKNEYGRFLIGFSQSNHEFDEDGIITKLKKVFGIANFSFVRVCSSEWEKIFTTAMETLKEQSAFSSFRVLTRRVDKRFTMRSTQVNEKLGAAIQQKTGARVDLKNAERTLAIEILSKHSYLSWERLEGGRGLPVGTSEKVLVMISGGIDSPVAIHRMLGRGCEVEVVHFHSYPLTDASSQKKVNQLIDVLSTFSPNLILLHMISMAAIQKKIVKDAPEALRVLLYRYGMFRLAEYLAMERGISGIVTGESIGQVASQTLSNMIAVTSGMRIPIFRPLLAMSKLEIIEQAISIGTYPISILPDQDCCSLFTPRHPETRASLETLKEIVTSLKLGSFIDQYHHRHACQPSNIANA